MPFLAQQSRQTLRLLNKIVTQQMIMIAPWSSAHEDCTLHTWLTVRVYVPLGAKQSWPKQKVRRCGFLQIYQTFFSLAEICCHISLYNQWVRVKKYTKVFTPCVAQQSWRSWRLPSKLVTLIAPWSSPHQDNEMVDCTTYSVCATQADQSKRSDVAAPHSLRSYTHKHYWPGGEQGVGLNEMWTP